MNVDGAVGNLQMLHQCLRVINIRLVSVGHQHAIYIFPAISRYGQSRYGGAVFPAGNADDSGFSVTLGHLLVHPFQQPCKLQLRVKFHVRSLLMPLHGAIVRQTGEKCKSTQKAL